MAPWAFAWICCPELPYHLCNKRDAQQKFLQHRGAHTNNRESGVVPANQTKQRPIREPVRQTGVVHLHADGFFLARQGEFTPKIANCTEFSDLSLLLQGKPPRTHKIPRFCERTRESAFGLPERLLKEGKSAII